MAPERRIARHIQVHQPIESMVSIARKVTRTVKRWRNGRMAIRWTAAGLLDAKRFRTVKGYREMLRPSRSRSTTNDLHSLGRVPNNQPWMARNSTI